MKKTIVRGSANSKKARAQHAGKPHARRSPAGRPAAAAVFAPTADGPESQTVGDEFKLQAEARSADDSDAEAGIYGLKRGETAG
jgi:hypothetical protein